jgi:MoaA/NifB/PqqE/SkfB family radical SAM enzyme
MYSAADYIQRGYVFLNNSLRPQHKKLASLMIYATDLCDSACKHCLIWTKRPVNYLPKQEIFKLVKSKCVTKFTKIGLEGGEFLLHPEAMEILEWFKKNHPNFDLLSNCLRPVKLIEAVVNYTPQRLWISLDGTEETYKNMRGKDGYHKVIEVIERLKDIVPVSLMFTLSPYNDFDDLIHVAEVAKKYSIDLRVGIYNNIDFFDTIDKAHSSQIGSKKEEDPLNFKTVKKKTLNAGDDVIQLDNTPGFEEWHKKIPEQLKKFKENYDFVLLYNLWQQNQLHIRCFSIFDNVIVLPNGDVPICQNLSEKLGNVHFNSLDNIINSASTIKTQNFHSKHCNGCWINYHRKQDIVLYRNLEKVFGSKALSKLMGYYQWDDHLHSYKQLIK